MTTVKTSGGLPFRASRIEILPPWREIRPEDPEWALVSMHLVKQGQSLVCPTCGKALSMGVIKENDLGKGETIRALNTGLPVESGLSYFCWCPHHREPLEVLKKWKVLDYDP